MGFKGWDEGQETVVPVSYPYRCFLPDLAEFGGRRHPEPGHQSHKTAGGHYSPQLCFLLNSGGERGIRTLDTPCGRIRAFQARSFNRSDISPLIPSAPAPCKVDTWQNGGLFPMARPARLERAAFGPAIRRSIQLSYGRFGSKSGNALIQQRHNP